MQTPPTENAEQTLRRIVALESTLYQQKQARERAQKALEACRPMLRPAAEVFSVSDYPDPKLLGYGSLRIALICFIISLAALILAWPRLDLVAVAAPLLVAAVVIYLLITRARDRQARARQQYAREMLQLQREVEQELQQQESRYRRLCEMLNDAFDLAIAETESDLDALYRSAPIAPEYRNLAAVCCLYDGIRSGRGIRPPESMAQPLSDLEPDAIAESCPTLSRELARARRTLDDIPRRIRQFLVNGDIPAEAIIPAAAE